MREIKIKASKEYNVVITSGYQNLLFQLETHKVKNLFIIADKNVYNLYKEYFNILKDKTIGMYIINSSEEIKNHETVLKIYEAMIKYDINKRAAVAAIGGGIAGDLAGFAASTFMRGLKLIHIPTTLIAQCDSSIGGKNGYNFNSLKNLIGNIYQPFMVYIDVNFLKTLNEKEYLNGMSEVIKYGFVCDKNLFNFIFENKKGIKEREIDKLLHIIAESIKIKGSIIEEDEFDNDKRQILNFGHTVGHAIESLYNFKISHGEAVSIGMNVETYIALKSGLIDEQSYLKLTSILNYFNLPLKYDDLEAEKILEYMKKDKKKTSNEIKLILPDQIGHAKIINGIKNNFILEAINEIQNKK